jgi:hypothetical protein
MSISFLLNAKQPTFNKIFSIEARHNWHQLEINIIIRYQHQKCCLNWDQYKVILKIALSRRNNAHEMNYTAALSTRGTKSHCKVACIVEKSMAGDRGVDNS